MPNPLLSKARFPLFSKIQAQHIEPAVEACLERYRTIVEEVIEDTAPPTWDNFVAPLEEMADRLFTLWAPVSHLNAVNNTKVFQKAYELALQKLTEFYVGLGQNEKLYQKYLTVSQSEAFTQVTPAQQQTVLHAIRDFTLVGVGLNKEDKQRVVAIEKELTQLSSEFSENVLEATDSWHYHVTDLVHLQGIPELALHRAEQAAQNVKVKGWIFTLDYPSYHAVISYAQNRELRETMYRAYVTRASDMGPLAGKWDNKAIMENIVMLRTRMAQLLGFSHYAEYAVVTKMADSSQEVLGFLNRFSKTAKLNAQKEWQKLCEYAKETEKLGDLNAWDVAYFSEKMLKDQFKVDHQALRAYFPLERVLQGLFSVTERLFGITVKAINTFNSWDPSVQLFEVCDRDKQVKGCFYLDLFSRAHKRSGAWAAACKLRYRRLNGSLQEPLAFVVANFEPPVNSKPALLTHDDVITLFHEFGHCLHKILTVIEVHSVSGNEGVEWDAVELPSQFLENWAWSWEGLQLISGHYQTGDPLPKEVFDNLRGSKQFQAGMFLVRQLEFGLFDFELHTHRDPETVPKIQAILDQVREKISVVPMPTFNRFANTFSHIFDGGYAAGYYSYLWAEVLACDAFSMFEGKGIFDEFLGECFKKTILEQGGAYPSMVLFKQFRGRAPSINPFLQAHGLAEAVS